MYLSIPLHLISFIHHWNCDKLPPARASCFRRHSKTCEHGKRWCVGNGENTGCRMIIAKTSTVPWEFFRVSKFFKQISGRFVWRQKASSLPSRFSYWICYDQKAALKKHKIRTLLDLVGQPLVNSGHKGQVAAARKINRWSIIWREFHQITQIYPIDLGLCYILAWLTYTRVGYQHVW